MPRGDLERRVQEAAHDEPRVRSNAPIDPRRLYSTCLHSRRGCLRSGSSSSSSSSSCGRRRRRRCRISRCKHTNITQF